MSRWLLVTHGHHVSAALVSAFCASVSLQHVTRRQMEMITLCLSVTAARKRCSSPPRAFGTAEGREGVMHVWGPEAMRYRGGQAMPPRREGVNGLQ
ncbi:hypothetical protein E2C01_007114 [Portunus trituberculatus]|uniref:Secreted protein n=1 Tax=Portunus trituberculatus TaxID=210409 RepID=A0A5B7CY31_PORTR|nr:hypothetical protein [Portunus trituberculatus]